MPIPLSCTANTTCPFRGKALRTMCFSPGVYLHALSSRFSGTVVSASSSACTAGSSGARTTSTGKRSCTASTALRTTRSGGVARKSNFCRLRSSREKVRKFSIRRLKRAFSRAISSRYSRVLVESGASSSSSVSTNSRMDASGVRSSCDTAGDQRGDGHHGDGQHPDPHVGCGLPARQFVDRLVRRGQQRDLPARQPRSGGQRFGASRRGAARRCHGERDLALAAQGPHGGEYGGGAGEGDHSSARCAELPDVRCAARLQRRFPGLSAPGFEKLRGEALRRVGGEVGGGEFLHQVQTLRRGHGGGGVIVDQSGQ